SLLGIGPLSHATGRPLVRSDSVTARQRAAARAAVSAAGTSHVGHIPIAIPIVVVEFLVSGWGSRLERRAVVSSPTYALIFAGLLIVTHTLSFSVSNDPVLFGARLSALGALAALAQLRVGGRASLVPAAFVASLAVLWTAVGAARQPLAPADGTLCFLPIPALGGLVFICGMTVFMQTRGMARVPSASRRSRAPRAVGAMGMAPGEPALAAFTGLLRYVPLSIAFPVTTGMSILGVQVLAARWLFHESIDGVQWAGAMLIGVGVFLVKG